MSEVAELAELPWNDEAGTVGPLLRVSDRHFSRGPASRAADDAACMAE